MANDGVPQLMPEDRVVLPTALDDGALVQELYRHRMLLTAAW